MYKICQRIITGSNYKTLCARKTSQASTKLQDTRRTKLKTWQYNIRYNMKFIFGSEVLYSTSGHDSNYNRQGRLYYKMSNA